MKQPVLLRIFRGDKLEGIKQFTDSQIIIGRNADVQVALNDESISPLHTSIEEREDGYYISDLGSQGGTSLAGHKILDQKIESADEFQIGPYRIQFFIGIPGPMGPPSPQVEKSQKPAPVSQPPVSQSQPQPPVNQPVSSPVPPPPSKGETSPSGSAIGKPAPVSQPPVSQSQLQPPVNQPVSSPVPPPPSKGETSPSGSAIGKPAPVSQPPVSQSQPQPPVNQPVSSPVPPPPSKGETSPSGSAIGKPAPVSQPPVSQSQPQSPVNQPVSSPVFPPPSKGGGASPSPTSPVALVPEIPTSRPSSPIQDSSSHSSQASVADSKPSDSSVLSGSSFIPSGSVQGMTSPMQGASIRPDRGTIVEVLVAWRERVISSHHFSGKRSVTVGTDSKCDVIVPFLGSSKKQHRLLYIDSLATVCIEQSMSGDYIRDDLSKVSFTDLMRKSQFSKTSNGYELQIPQGDMLRIGLQGDLVSIYIRYVPETPKPLVAPILDLTVSEVTGVILAMVVSAVVGLYMMIYSPSGIEEEEKLEEQLRRAVVTFAPPKKIVQQPPPPKKEVLPKPEKKKVVTVAKKKVEKKVKPVPTKKVEVKKPKKPKRGKVAEVRPQKRPIKKKPKKLTSTRPGGAQKTGKRGSSIKSEKVDPSKTGILQVFGSKGTQKTLGKVYHGSGELIGVADSATGFSGQLSDREGESLGTKTKNTGAGGRGKSTVGISGVGTKGKGTGDFSHGVGGLNKRNAVVVSVGGQEAEFIGSLDREAIRRVIQKNKRIIKNCYDRELNRDKDLYGKLVLRWNIVEKGRVTKAKVVSSSLGSQAVAKCIIARLKTWRFPEPPQNTEGEVTYPFVFAAQ